MAGFMTKSFLSSPEHHASKKERAAATRRYEQDRKASPAAFPVREIPVACRCRKWPFPHIHPAGEVWG
jgi:hypothetical protein